MRYIKFYEKKGIKKDKVFDYLLTTLKPSIKNWGYFVNWKKVKSNAQHLKIELNLLNSLIGSDNLEHDFKSLVKKYPSIIDTIPFLLAVRESELSLLNDSLLLEQYKFSKESFKESDLDYGSEKKR